MRYLRIGGELHPLENFMVTDMPKIVEATGTAGSSGSPTVSAKEVEQAMADAVRQAYADGITDPDEIRRLQLEARDNLTKPQ